MKAKVGLWLSVLIALGLVGVVVFPFQKVAASIKAGRLRQMGDLQGFQPGFGSCISPTVQIEANPHGVIQPGRSVAFSVAPSGAGSGYLWQVNGSTVGNTASLFYTFEMTGTYTVTVEFTDSCGWNQGALLVSVRWPLPDEPDLTGSWMRVAWDKITSGEDRLTHTVVLRNSHNVGTIGIYTDVLVNSLLPRADAVLLVTDSVRASSGGVTFVDGLLQWRGRVISGTPVVIQYAIVITDSGLSEGDFFTKLATVNDGRGNERIIGDGPSYKPFFAMMINRGALWTHIPTVTVGLTWSTTLSEPVTEIRLSNDSQFTGSTWISATSEIQWRLDGASRLAPYSVYVWFRDRMGQEYGPFESEIVYDDGNPVIGYVQVLPWGGATLQISGTDDNSGVGEVQVSVSSTFTTFQAVAAGTDIPWPTLRTTPVYVRVVDRAGNLSPVQEVTYPEFYRIYLPLTLRKG